MVVRGVGVGGRLLNVAEWNAGVEGGEPDEPRPRAPEAPGLTGLEAHFEARVPTADSAAALTLSGSWWINRQIAIVRYVLSVCS